jgi:hypothetical protein
MKTMPSAANLHHRATITRSFRIQKTLDYLIRKECERNHTDFSTFVRDCILTTICHAHGPAFFDDDDEASRASLSETSVRQKMPKTMPN